MDRGNGSCPLSIPFCFLAMLDRTVLQPCVVLFNGIAPFQARLLFEPGVWIPTNGVGWLVETFPFEEQAVVDACSTGSSQEARMERGGTFPSVATTTGLDAHRSILHFNSSHPPAPPLPPKCLNPSREKTPSGNGARQFSWNADAKRTFHGVFGRDSDLLAIEGGIVEA